MLYFKLHVFQLWSLAMKDILVTDCVLYNCGLLGRRQLSWEVDSAGEKRRQ